MTDMKKFVAKVALGEVLDETAAEQAFNIIMSGDATPAQIGGFLLGFFKEIKRRYWRNISVSDANLSQ